MITAEKAPSRGLLSFYYGAAESGMLLCKQIKTS